MPSVTLEACVCLGSAGYPVSPGSSCHLVLSDAAVAVHAGKDMSVSVPLLEVCSIDISGPGTVTTGGGFAGGGFGVEGALQGIAVATVLNALTARSKIHTFVTVITNVGELHFHYAGMEPSALRVALASTYTALRRLDPNWQRARLAALEYDKKYRGLPDHEFERLATRILQPLPPHPEVAPATQAPAAVTGPLGMCPSCKTIIQLHADECPRCKALFGADSAWRVIPQ